MDRHRHIVSAEAISCVIVGGWHEVSMRVTSVEAAAHIRGNLDRAEVTPLECGYLLVDRLLWWLVLLEIARSRCLPVAVDELVKVYHSIAVAAQSEEEQG